MTRLAPFEGLFLWVEYGELLCFYDDGLDGLGVDFVLFQVVGDGLG